MLSCRRVRGLVAASLYEDLTEQERQQLDTHLNTCSRCRAERESMASFLQKLPATAPTLDFDLTPMIRKQLNKQPSHTPAIPFRVFRPAWGLLAAVMLFMGIITYHSVFNAAGRETTQPVANKSDSTADEPLRLASGLVDNREYAKAFSVLKTFVSEHPGTASAAQAQIQLADVAFTRLNWYKEAYEAYETLASHYPSAYADNPECIARHNCLAEARSHDFAPLYALDAAHRSGLDQFAQLENVIGHYPGTFIAAVAAEDLAKIAAKDLVSKPGGATEGNLHLAAMVSAKDRCVNPVATACLKLEVGHIYVKELNNPVKAREFYREVADGGEQTIAKLAQECLARLDNANH